MMRFRAKRNKRRRSLGCRMLRGFAGFGAGLGLGLACRRTLANNARAVEIENEDARTEKDILEQKRAILQQQIETIDEQLKIYDEE